MQLVRKYWIWVALLLIGVILLEIANHNLYMYGSPTGLNWGVVWGNWGFELKGAPGPFHGIDR